MKRREPLKFGGTLVRSYRGVTVAWRGWPQETCHLFMCVNLPNLVALYVKCHDRNNFGYPAGKKWPFACIAPFKSLKVIRTDGSMGYFWLPINIRWQSWAYLVLFLRKTMISVESCKFSHPMYLTPPLRQFPLEFCNHGRPQKLAMPLPYGVKSLTIGYVHSFRYNTSVWHTDRQTDGQIFNNSIALCSLHAYACCRAAAIDEYAPKILLKS